MKKIQFKKLLTDMKRFIQKKTGDRSILKCLRYDGKHLYATDSHVAIRVNADYVDDLPSKDPFTYDVYGNKVTDEHGDYPNLNRLFADSFRTEVRLSPEKLEELRQSTDLMHGVAKDNKNHTMRMDIINGGMKLSVDTLEEDKFWGNVSGAQVIRDMDIDGEDVNLSISADYLKKSLMSVDKLRKLGDGDNEVNVRFNGNMRPITIDSSDIFEALVLPVRVYEGMKDDGRRIEPESVGASMIDEDAPTIGKRTADAYKKRNQRKEKPKAEPKSQPKPKAAPKPQQEPETNVKEACDYLDERITSHTLTIEGRLITARKRDNIRGHKNFEIRILVDGGVSVNVSRKTTTRYENLDEALQGIEAVAEVQTIEHIQVNTPTPEPVNERPITEDKPEGNPECVSWYCEDCGLETIFVATDTTYTEYICALYEDHEGYKENSENYESTTPTSNNDIDPEQPTITYITSRNQNKEEQNGKYLTRPLLYPSRHKQTRGTLVLPKRKGTTLFDRRKMNHKLVMEIERRTRGPTHNQVYAAYSRKTRRKRTIY